MAKGPKAPDPVATAQAQAQYNTEAGTAQQGLNMVDQSTPFGSLSYSQTGTNADGTPKFSATQTYAPQVQQSIDNLLGKISGTSGAADPTAYQMDLYNKYYSPLNDQAQRKLDNTLQTQGITAGSDAYNNAQNLQARNVGDQQTNWLLNSSQLANQPYEQLSSLRTGAAPGFAQTPTVSVQPPNYSGLVQQNYQNEVASSNALNQGLFGIGSGLAGGWALGGFKNPLASLGGAGGAAGLAASDIRLKENVAEVGRLDNGLKVYRFNYIGDNVPQIGLMAQDVEKVNPDAVTEIGGYKYVDYRKATVS